MHYHLLSTLHIYQIHDKMKIFCIPSSTEDVILNFFHLYVLWVKNCIEMAALEVLLD